MVRRARLRPWFFTSIFAWSRPIVVLVLSLTFLFIISRGLSLALQGEMSFSSLLAKGRQLALGALLGLSLQARPASAASSSMLLYSASYNGYITTLNLTLSGTSCGGVSGGDGSCNATLKTLEFHDGCWPDPAWLELDKANSVLYCSDEGISARNGSLVSFRTSPLGTLEVLNKVETLKGPVSSVIYGGGKAMALAH